MPFRHSGKWTPRQGRGLAVAYVGISDKTLEDLTKTAIADHSLPGNGFSLVVGTSRYQINKVTLRIVMRNERTIASVEHRVLGDDAMLSSGRVGEVDMTIAQTAGACEGKVFLQPVPTRKRRRKRRAS
jgi:hypothetical protein